MPFLRQSTSQVIRFGPCLDKTDGVTEETGLTLAQADMRLSKDGAAFAQKSAAGNATHDSDGWYSTTLSTTDTATVGELRLNVHQPANMLPVWDRWWVLEEAVYDKMYGASAAGPNIGKTGYSLTQAFPSNFDTLIISVEGQTESNVAKWVGNAVTHGAGGPDVNINAISDDTAAAANLELFTEVLENATGLIDAGTFKAGAINAAAIATDAIGAAELADDALVEIANKVWDTDATARQTQGTFGQAIGDPGADADTIYGSVVTGAAGANIAVDIISVKSTVDNIENGVSIIIQDTNEIQGKLPTNKFMGSSDGADDDGTLNTISTNVDDIKAATIMASGVVETSGSNSSTQVQTDLAEATNDHYDVMTIAFTSGAEAGQSRLITGYVGSTGVVSWNAALTGTPADDVTFVILAAGTTADAVWDEILTGNSHNIATSAGKRLRQLEQAFTLASGTVAAVSGHKITLDAGAVATTDFYISARLQITEGNGAGQSRVIVAYSSGKVATLDSEFITAPNTASLYEVISADVHVSVSDADLAEGFVNTATSTTTITLDDGAVATTDYYKDMTIVFTHGPGAGQSREIEAYTSGRVVTMNPALVTAVTTATTWHIQTTISASHIVDEMLTTQMTESYAANAAAPTLAQCQFAIHQMLMQFGISGTSLTVRKLDDSTTAFVVTLDDATNPTDAKRV